MAACSWLRRRSDAGDLSPNLEGLGSGGTILGGMAVLGFYTLSATSIQLTDVPAPLAKKLPRHPRLPATLLGRLATNLSARGVGLGRFLLADAIVRSVRSEIASFALVLDAKDEGAAGFYGREGFIRLPGTPVRLLRRMEDLAALVPPG